MWVSLALLCAALTGSADALAKQLLVRSNERVVAWAILLLAVPWLCAGLLLRGLPPLPAAFWWTLAVMVPLEITAHLCHLRALRIAPLSLAGPFLAFTPMLCALTAWLFLGERVSILGMGGVGLITLGAYVLQAELVRQGVLEPFKAMSRVPGIRLMLITAAIYGVTSTLGKRAIQLSSPVAFMAIYFSIVVLFLTEIARRSAGSARGLLEEARPQIGLYLLAGLVTAAALYTHCFGIPLSPVAYFIAIKRLSLLVGVLYGGLLFREEALGWRAAGAALMLAGAGLIGLGR